MMISMHYFHKKPEKLLAFCVVTMNKYTYNAMWRKYKVVSNGNTKKVFWLIKKSVCISICTSYL